MSGTGCDVVTPELALVDAELAKALRQISDRKAAMSTTPANGTFFIDPAQPAPPPSSSEISDVPVPLPAPVAAAAESVRPVPEPTPAPAAQPATAALPVDNGSTPMRDVPLGTLIFRAGLLAEEQLEDALQEGMRSGKRLGEVLLERGWLHERDLGRLLAGQKGLPFVEIRASDAEPDALVSLPEEKARMQIALPLRYEDGQLVVAVADPSNELVIENLRRSLGSEPRLVVAPQAELIRAINEAYTGVPAHATAPEQEPTPQPAPVVQAEPTLQSEAPPTPEPPVAPEPPLALEPTIAQETAPLPEQPASPPVVAPLPTASPPEETRHPAAAPLLQPLIAEPAAEVVEPHVAVEPMALSVPPVEGTPAPLLEQPALQTEPSSIPPEAVTPPEPQPLQAEPAPAPVEPLIPVAPLQPPVEVDVVEPRSLPEAPPEPLAPPAAEQPLESAPAPFEEVVTPAPAELPVEAPVVSQEPRPGPPSVNAVILRLRDGEALEVGTFPTAAEASARAQQVVQQISAAESDATWPFFGERYLRPDTIVSVDLLEESADKWLGSAVRNRWAHPEQA